MEQYTIDLTGISPLIVHNGAAGLDKFSPYNVKIRDLTSKRSGNKTSTDEQLIAELECARSLYLDADGAPTFPTSGVRSCLETAARKLKQGPLVREGVVVTDLIFEWDKTLGRTVDELMKKAQYSVPVVVQRARVIRTRAKFDEWTMSVTLDVDDELIERQMLESWLDIAGRRIGLGDWRPEKSGSCGRFTSKII